MILRVLGRITPLKLALTFIAGFAPALFPRIVCERGADWAFCLPVSLSQFFPFVQGRFGELDTALSVLQVLGRPLERILDVGYAFFAVSLVLLVVYQHGALRGPETRERTTFAALWCFVLAYVIQQLGPVFGDPTLVLTDALRLSAGTLAKDLVDLAVYAWVLFVVLHDPAQSDDDPRVARTRTALAGAALAVQVASMAYRYSGMSFAPTPSFGLLLGAAFVISPLQLLLMLVTSYHFPPSERPRAE